MDEVKRQPEPFAVLAFGLAVIFNLLPGGQATLFLAALRFGPVINAVCLPIFCISVTALLILISIRRRQKHRGRWTGQGYQLMASILLMLNIVMLVGGLQAHTNRNNTEPTNPQVFSESAPDGTSSEKP